VRGIQKRMNERPVGKIVIYQAENGRATLEVRLEQETIWLDAHQMAKLFERDRSVIVRHIRNIYETKELSRDSTCAKNAQVAAVTDLFEGQPQGVPEYSVIHVEGMGGLFAGKSRTELG